MNKFERGKIYTIRSHKTPLIYVGSTTEKYLSNRIAKHRSSFKRYKNNKFHYLAVFDIFELDGDCYIELYEKYPCDSKEELDKREGEIIRQLDCCNKHIAGRTAKEYREDTKQHRLEYAKQYRINNKEQIKTIFYQKFQCECGSKYTYHHKARHLKTKKHRDYMEFMYN